MRDDAGYTTRAVITTALLVVLALHRGLLRPVDSGGPGPGHGCSQPPVRGGHRVNEAL